MPKTDSLSNVLAVVSKGISTVIRVQKKMTFFGISFPETFLKRRQMSSNPNRHLNMSLTTCHEIK